METQRFDFPIKGMTGAVCASQIENQLKSLPGVQDAQISLATETVTLFFDLRVLTIDQITEITPLVLQELSGVCQSESGAETQVDGDGETTWVEHNHKKVGSIALRETINQIIKRMR